MNNARTADHWGVNNFLKFLENADNTKSPYVRQSERVLIPLGGSRTPGGIRDSLSEDLGFRIPVVARFRIPEA